MRIISKTHDYYDTAQSFGQDMSIVYKRDIIEFRENNLPENVLNIVSKINESTNLNHNFRSGWYYRPDTCVLKDKKRVSLNYGHIVFCGKVYPFIKLFGTYENIPDEFFYSLSSFEERVEGATFNCNKDYKRHIRKFFEVTEQDRLYEFLVEKKVISLLLYGNAVVVNPILSEYNFYKVKPAWEAYQEIDSYICGVLSFPQNAMVEIEDKYRIEQHGFDKWSFRKLPTKGKK